METTYIHWNIVNWITVFLMVAAGYLVIGLATQLIKNKGLASG